MTTPLGPTREEFVMLRDEVRDTARRVAEIDTSGSRGMGAVAVQITSLARDLNAVRLDLDGFRKDHAYQHDRELRDRLTGRRWLTGTMIAALAAIEVPLIWLLTHVH